MPTFPLPCTIILVETVLSVVPGPAGVDVRNSIADDPLPVETPDARISVPPSPLLAFTAAPPELTESELPAPPAERACGSTWAEVPKKVMEPAAPDCT